MTIGVDSLGWYHLHNLWGFFSPDQRLRQHILSLLHIKYICNLKFVMFSV